MAWMKMGKKNAFKYLDYEGSSFISCTDYGATRVYKIARADKRGPRVQTIKVRTLSQMRRS